MQQTFQMATRPATATPIQAMMVIQVSIYRVSSSADADRGQLNTTPVVQLSTLRSFTNRWHRPCDFPRDTKGVQTSHNKNLSLTACDSE